MSTQKPFDRRLVLTLSLFGLVMAFATVWVIPPKLEPVFWLAIFGTCAVVIAKRAPGRYFLHGFSVSLANCVWITSVHVLFRETYLAHHVEEAASLAKMPLPDSPRLMMAMLGPVIGIVSGLVLGALSFGASKLFAPRPARG